MKKKINKNYQRGSISLFVLLSMIFFIVIVTSVAASVKNKEAKVNAEYKKIKVSYEKNVGNEEQKDRE